MGNFCQNLFCFNEDKKGELKEYAKKYEDYQNIFADDPDDKIFKEIINTEIGYLKESLEEYYNSKITEISSNKTNLNIYYNKESTKEILNDDNGKKLLKEIILNEIDEIKNEPEKFKVENLSILVIGRKGVGKTPLINYVLQSNNIYNCNIFDNFNNYQVFTNRNVHYLRLIEFKGIGYGDNNPESIKNKALEYIKEQEKNNDYNNIIHCIWYCISGNKFEKPELGLLKELKEVYEKKDIPIIVIYNKPIDDKMANEMLKYIENLKINASTITVRPYKDRDQSGEIIETYGRDELLNLTLTKCTEALKGKMISIMTGAISSYITVQINKKNNENNSKIFNDLIDDFTKNYNIKLNSIKFEEYLINILKKNIIYLYDAQNDENKKSKLKPIFDKLNQSNILISPEENYEQFYINNIEEWANKTSEEKAINFLINQANEEIKNGEIIIKNKRAREDFIKSNQLFFKKNFYFIFQKMIIKNFILNNKEKYYNYFQEYVESEIRDFLNNDKIVMDKLTNCFLNKLKQFADDKNIELNININELDINNGRPLKKSRFENKDNNENFENSNDDPEYMFKIDNSTEAYFNQLFKEQYIKINYKQYLYLNFNFSKVINIFAQLSEYQGLNKYFPQNGNDDIYMILIEKIKQNLINYYSSKVNDFIFNIKQTYENKLINYTANRDQIDEHIFNYIDYSSIDEKIKNIILREKKSFFINKIEKKVKNEKNMINYITIIIVGKTGVGKSKITNAIFKEYIAEEGMIKPITMQNTVYKPTRKNPIFQIIDTVGIELSEERGFDKIFANAENSFKTQIDSNNLNDMLHCIWYCVTGSYISKEEINTIINLQKLESIPLIIVYTQKTSDRDFNIMKKQINQKIKNVEIIPILVEDMETTNKETNKTTKFKKFGLEELKIKTLEICQKTKGYIYKRMKDKIIELIENELYKENDIFEEYSKQLIFNSFLNKFKNVKNETGFLKYIIELLGISFRKRDSEVNNISNESKKELNNIDIIFNDIKNCIEFFKNRADECINSISNNMSIDFLDAQAVIEKINSRNILTNLKKNDKDFKYIIENFLKDNFYYISEKFIIYYSIIFSFIPFIKEVKKISNEIFKYLLENESEYFYERLYNNIFEDLLNKNKNNNY